MVLSKNIYIPSQLIVTVSEHPEAYGHLIIELENRMKTDVYYDEVKNLYFTITNDKKLIKYLKRRRRKIK